jgi:carbamoyltransferase
LSKHFLGIFEGHFDPAVAIVCDGEVLAYSEEERHLRFKHAPRIYPLRALRYCLRASGIGWEDVAGVGINWDLPAYSDGTLRRFFEGLRQEQPVDGATIAWQEGLLRRFDREGYRAFHHSQWRRAFGEQRYPELHAFGHHQVHAFHAAMQSPFDRSVVLTIDGSGDSHCTILWRHEGLTLEPLRAIVMPHSLGWVYAAFTEYLGFRAYDGEYKVMGLAAYGRPDASLSAALDRIVTTAPDGIEYRVDPRFIHYGAHTHSDRYTDALVALLGRPPRLPEEEIGPWHEDLAFAVQSKLERSVEPLVAWAIKTTGIPDVCVGGGVGLNVKMNSRLFELPGVRDFFAQPLCSDGGAAAGAALLAWSQATGERPARLRTLALGAEDSNEEIEQALKIARLDYDRPQDICAAVAEDLARGRIVGWFQGRMEAGPRALGQRSILADPRDAANRDRVNAIVKFREYWRPFCPSMTAEAAPRYFERWTDAPFMIIAFRANERLKREAPGIVHVDGTARVQLVHEEVLPRYHRLLVEFEKRAGVPVLLNTSFNVKGEPIVCTIHDALRTFWSTGIEVLAAGDFLVRKPRLAAGEGR